MKIFKAKKDLGPEKRKSLMIVDDSQSMRMVIGSLFEKEYDVVYKEDGQIALSYIAEGNIPDLILLDMEMPNMNGRVFLRRLKHNMAFRNIPVIFISSVNSRLIIDSMIRQGVTDYLIKPFKPEELTLKVYSILNEKS